MSQSGRHFLVTIMLTVYAGRPWYVIVYSVIQRSPFPRIRLTLKPDGLPGW